MLLAGILVFISPIAALTTPRRSTALPFSIPTIPRTIGTFSTSNVNPAILTGGTQGSTLVSYKVISNVLTTTLCSASQTVGVGKSGSASPVCACVNSGAEGVIDGATLSTLESGEATTCPACPVNSRQICHSANCGCQKETQIHADHTLQKS